MTDIVLTTANARYGHTALGLRCLQANLGALAERSVILEFDLHKSPQAMAERIAALRPAVVGIGVYIWNAHLIPELIRFLRERWSQARIVLGGPEVSYETSPEWLDLSDAVIAGEADLEFTKLCVDWLQGKAGPESKLRRPGPPPPSELALPYDRYTEEDLAQRTLYVETSRGCAFSCEYCLSSIERGVRFFPQDRLFAAFEKLLERGARHFKFVDRTFNLNIAHALALLQFFLEHYRPGLFLHFEMIPDRFPPELRALIQAFPPESMQFEIGIQTWNPEVAARIQRIQHPALIEENLRFLRQETGVYLHADLIAGLPGESGESFAAGFDRLVALRPHEIQVGLLKRLRGTAIGRHDREWAMQYQAEPPYRLLANRLLGPEAIEQIHRLAHVWDAVYNSGNFIGTTPLLWESAASPFQAFLEFSEALHRHFQREHGIALDDLAEFLHLYLIRQRKLDPARVSECLARDYLAAGRPHLPPFLRPAGPTARASAKEPPRPGLQRQSRHFRAARDGQ